VPIGIGELFVYSWIEECVASLCRGSFRSLLLLTQLHLLASKATYVRFSFQLELLKANSSVISCLIKT
jgi:hypothetical protein